MLRESNERQFLEANGAIRDFIDTMISGEDTWVYGVIRSNNIFNTEETNVLIQLAILKPLDEFLPILDAIYGGYKTSTEVQGFLDSLAMLCGACHQSGINKFLFNNLCVGEPPVQEIQQYIIQLLYDQIKDCSFQQVQDLLQLITQARADSSWTEKSSLHIKNEHVNAVQVIRERVNARIMPMGFVMAMMIPVVLVCALHHAESLYFQAQRAMKRGVQPKNPDDPFLLFGTLVHDSGLSTPLFLACMISIGMITELYHRKAPIIEAKRLHDRRLQDLLQQIPGNEEVFQELQPLLTAAEGVLPLQVLFSTEAENAALVQRLSAGSTVVAQALAMPFHQAQSAPQVEVTTEAQAANPK